MLSVTLTGSIHVYYVCTFIAVSEKIDKRCSFLVLIFLTYGEHGIIYAKDKKVALQELLAPLKGDKCLHLAGKPKIIILQVKYTFQGQPNFFLLPHFFILPYYCPVMFTWLLD